MTAGTSSGSIQFEALATWQRLPDGMKLLETPGVAVDGKDQVYAITRNPENPVLVFSKDGELLATFGQGIFGNRTHGVTIGPDGMVYCTDDGTHTVTKFTPEGQLLMTIGTPGKAAKAWSGDPFCRPTQAAVSARTGHIFISDGYLNARVHKYTPDGRLVKSWGEPGIDPGQFIIPHNIAVDAD